MNIPSSSLKNPSSISINQSPSFSENDISSQIQERELKQKEIDQEKLDAKKHQQNQIITLKDVLEKEYSALNTKTEFNESASSYDEDPETQSFFLAEKSSVLKSLDLKPWESVLDVGCWTGKYLVEFSKVSNTKLYWMDLSSKMLDHAKSKSDLKDKVQYSTWDIWKDRLPFDDASLDKISCAHVIKFLNKEQCAHFLQEAQRVLKPGGKLVITNNTPADTENRENGSNIKRNAQIQEQINKQKEQIQWEKQKEESGPKMFPYTLDDYQTLGNQSHLQLKSDFILIDEKIKDMMTSESYDKVKNHPYLIQLTLTKPWIHQ